MARSSTTLTDAWVSRPQKAGLHWCRQNPGLGVRVGKTGTKSWVFQRSGGARITLARTNDMTVREARARAADLSARGRSVQAETLGAAFAMWAERCLIDGTAGTVDNRRRQLGKWVGDWWDKPLSSISRADLQRLHTHIGRSSAHAANDVLRHLGTIHRTASSDPWPGEGIRPLKPGPSRRKTMGDPVDWWRDVQQAESPVIHSYWKLIVLTGLRENDAKTARWDRFNDGWLHLPHAKGGKAFDYPVPQFALPQETSDWFFPGQREHIVNPKPPAIRHLCSEHALRHWWRAEAEIEVGCPYPIVQRLMNHSGKRGVTDVYGQREIRPEQLEDWAFRIANHIAEKIGL